MPVFPDIEVEPVVQVADRTRLSAIKSFVTTDVGDITMVEIDPGTTTFIDVTSQTDPTDLSQAYLDYCYGAAGTQTVVTRITAGVSNTVQTKSTTISVISAIDDKLFSTDADLAAAEPDILKWVREGRNTFKAEHRAAQFEIIRYLDEKGYTDSQLNPFTKAAIIDLNEVNLWSKFMVLRMIFEGISNTTDDVFEKKSERYLLMEKQHRDKALLRLDVDGDGQTFQDEGIYIQSGNLFRR